MRCDLGARDQSECWQRRRATIGKLPVGHGCVEATCRLIDRVGTPALVRFRSGASQALAITAGDGYVVNFGATRSLNDSAIGWRSTGNAGRTNYQSSMRDNYSAVPKMVSPRMRR
jgi:hypothetical protein